MSNVITFPSQPSQTGLVEFGPIVARWQEIAAYGDVGSVRVALARRLDAMPELIHVVVIGDSSWVGVAPVATLPDDEKGRAIADFTGSAVLRAIEHAEVEFAAQPEAC